MPTGLELLAQRYAKPTKPKRMADMFPADSDPTAPTEPPAETDLNNPSMLESTLRTVGLGGYAVRNALMGNVEGIGRNAIDALTAIPRAILPGDQSSWELSRTQDRPEFSDVIGGMEPGWGKLGVDIAGGIATDPLSFLGVGEFSAAAKAAKAANAGVKTARASGVGLLEAAQAAKDADLALKAARAAGTSRKAIGVGLPFMSPVAELPGTADALASLGRGVGAGTNLAAKGIARIPGGEDVLSGAGKLASSVRGIFGAQKATPEIEAALADAAAKGGATSLAARNAFIEANKGFAPDIQRKAHLLIQNIIEGDGPAKAGVIDATERLPIFGTEADQIARIDSRLAAAPWDNATKASVREAAIANSPVYRKLYSQATADQVLARPEVMQGDKIVPLANDLAPLDYVPRQFDMKTLDEAATHEQRGAALASMLKSRTITDSKALADKLNTPGVSIESDLGKIGADYGSQLGRATEQAAIAKNLGIKGFKNLVDPESRKAVNDVIDGLRKSGDHDSANMLNTAFNGLTPPTGFWKFLAGVNKPFKAAATAGIVIPRLNFTIGNVVSNVVQMAQNPEARKIALSQLKTLPRVIAGSIGDGLKTLGVRIPESDYDQLLKAAAGSDGTREGMMRLITDPQMKLAVQHGVLDGGFVSSEQLAANALTKGDPKKLQNWLYWTQDVARASEQRMRYGMFKDLLKHGETPEDAARIVSDTLFDYKFSSVGNRNARQLFPFGQYTFKAIPQAAKFLGERPAALAGLNAAYSQNDANKDPLPPWAQGNINIPLGTGESGNPQYLTSLRLPFEQLAKIPNPSGDLGDILSQVRSDVVGMASPLIKTGIAGLGGTDPRTGNPFMADDRTPNALQALGAPERGNLSRYYNALASTGVIQPAVTPIATISSILDDRKSGGIRALSALTGLNVLDVDEQQAMKQVLMDAIRRDPSIRSTPNFYQLQKTPQGQALLQQLRAVQKAVRDKKKKAKIVGPHKAKKPKHEKPHVIKTKNSQP